MAELDSLIDSILEQKKAPEVSYIDDKDGKAIKIQQAPLKGQGVFAQQSLSVKDPICSLKYPATMAIDSDFLSTTCYHCLVVTAAPLPLPSHGLASVKLKTCNGCHFAHFCDKDCQLGAWYAYHKFECKIFKKLKSNLPPAMVRAVMRVVLLKDRDKLASEEWNRIIGLAAHEQILAARGRTKLTEMAEGIKHHTESGMSIEMIQRLIFIMKSNATELPTPIHGGIGVMLEPLWAKLNHSCEPNAFIHRPQYTMTSGWTHSSQLSDDEKKTFLQVVPMRDIQEGEELFNCYVVPTESVKARRAKCMEDYFFECNCPKCLSDLKAISDLDAEHPGLSAQFEEWTKGVKRNLSQLKGDASAVRKAGAAMNKSEQFLGHPTLYTTGDFPQLAMGLILEGLKARVFDEALVNALRIYFLINPQRFVGGHNPTNLYTIFLMLDIIDALLSISTPSGVTQDTTDKWLRSLADRGLSKDSLIYWRRRICADLRKRVEGSAVKDLLVLVEKREEQGQGLGAEGSDLEGDKLKAKAEQELRSVLRLDESTWKVILADSGY